MINKWVAELMNKYSFIHRWEYKNTYYYFYYVVENEERCKKISFRATQKNIIDLIKQVKIETNWGGGMTKEKVLEAHVYDPDEE